VGRIFDRLRAFEDVVDEHLALGDSRAAIVVDIDPLRVSAYTDELDCSVVLAFPSRVSEVLQGEAFALKPGTRLLTVNTYWVGDSLMWDVWNGPKAYNRYANFYPVIAEVFSSDNLAIERRKAHIDEAEWKRCADAGCQYLERSGGMSRDGSPWKSQSPPTRRS